MKIEFPSSPSSARWENNFLIHHAALQDKPILLKVLEHNPSLGIIPDSEGHCVTHLLARGGSDDLLLQVLRAHPNLVDMLDAKGNTVLHYACTDPETIRELLDLGVSPAHANDKGQTPLMIIAYKGTRDCFRVLYEKDRYHTLLFILIQRFAKDIDSFREWMTVIQPSKKSLNEIVSKIVTPLRFACGISKEIFIYLMEAGADPNTTGFTREFPVFWLVANPGWWDILDRYKEVIDFSVRNIRWETPAMALFLNVQEPIILKEMPPILLKKLLSCSSPNTLNIDGQSLFHHMSANLILKHQDILFRKSLDPIIAESLGRIWRENKKLMRLLTSLPAWHDRQNDTSVEVDIPVIHPLFYSQFIHNMVIYAFVVYMEHRDILFIPPSTRMKQYRMTAMDTRDTATIKFRMNMMHYITCELNNLIDYVNPDIYYLPDLPDTFPDDKMTFYILSLIQNGPSHTNLILVNPFRKSVERFDPEGYHNDTDEELDKWLWSIFRSRVPKDYKFEGAMMKRKQHEMDAYQMMDNAFDDKRTGDPEGYCTAWVMWYLGMRAKNPRVDSSSLFCKSLRLLLRKRMTMRGFIRNFALWLSLKKNQVIISALGEDATTKDMFNEEEQKAICVVIQNILTANDASHSDTKVIPG